MSELVEGERGKILEALEKALNNSFGERFKTEIEEAMKSKNKVRRERAAIAYQRLLELFDILKNYELYEREEKESATFRTLTRMFEHFSNPHKRAFGIMLGVKKWVKNLSIPICYHVHIRRVKNAYSAVFEINYFSGDRLD
ncbi:MAG: hypothetical protein QXK24_02150 [Ignisphaera sp.]